MCEPQAMGRGAPTPRNCMVTGSVARYRSTRDGPIRRFRPPPPAVIRAYLGRANHGATL
jgi:hypothetical protein